MTQKKLTVAEVKRAALAYLQDKSLDLRKAVPGLVDAQYSDGKLVLLVTSELKNVPEIEHDGVKFQVEVDLVDDLVAPKGEEPISEKARRILAKYPGVQNAQIIDDKVSEAINPASVQRQDQAAYAAWKARHKAVKVQ